MKFEVPAQIKDETEKYFSKIVEAQRNGQKLEDVFDAPGLDALRKITASAGTSGPSMVRSIPTVTETDESGRTVGYDLFSLIMKKRILMLEGPVDETMASLACASLHYMSATKPTEPITIYVDSPGGSVLAGLAIYDTIRSMECPIKTIGVGMQASMGSILLASGDERYMTENSKLMIHQISGGQQGKATEMGIGYTFSQDLHEDLKNIYVRHIGLNHKFWDAVLENDTWLTAQQALKMGFIHGIAEVKRPAPFESECIRHEFNSVSEAKVPSTPAEIVAILNSVSARRGEAAEIRPQLVTALAQFPEYWTEGKKRMEAERVAKTSVANDNTGVSTAAPAVKVSGGPAFQ